jgi:hypothetical protein
MRRTARTAPGASRILRRLALRTSLVVSLVTLVAAGCGNDTTTPEQPVRDYASEAKSEINESNMDAELKKLQSEIEADLK